MLLAARTTVATAAVATVVAVLAALLSPTTTVPPGPTGTPGGAGQAGIADASEVSGVSEASGVSEVSEPSGSTASAGTAGRDAADATADGVTLAWPLKPRPEVARPFDPPDSEYGAGHRGVDLVAQPGQPVAAAAAGRVVYAGDLAGRGVVSIAHRDGLRTTYEPVSAHVAEGDRVQAGGRIGTVARGHDGCPDSTCLHWGLRRGEQYLDPLTVVAAAGPLRLKPWPG